MKLAWTQVALCSRLPDPELHAEEWISFILDCPMRWKSVVNSVHFFDSVCDPTPRSASCHLFKQLCCQQCAAAFASERALQSHIRRKHGIRCLQRLYIDENGQCPVCGTLFHTRLRCLAHLCDKRRTKCWDQLRGNTDSFASLPVDRVIALDAADRTAKREPLKAGHTHVLAQGSAVTAAGKRIGHVSR